LSVYCFFITFLNEKSTIKGKKASATSLMPVGLIMSPNALKHIVKYLSTLKTTSQPKR